jgi:hypothetical protein
MGLLGAYSAHTNPRSEEKSEAILRDFALFDQLKHKLQGASERLWIANFSIGRAGKTSKTRKINMFDRPPAQ